MIRINLLPIKQLQAEVTRRREIITAAIALGGALLLMLGAHFFQGYQISGSEKELARLRAEILAINARVKEVAELQAKIKDARGKQKIIEELNRKKSGPVLVMASLSAATPASLWLTELKEAGGSVTMNGLATDNETVANFMRSLIASKNFNNVELIETTQGAGPEASLKKFAIKAGVIYRPPDSPSADANSKKDDAPGKTQERKS